MAAQPDIEVCVLGFPAGGTQDGNEGTLGDCPFCQRVLLTLEEKGLLYSLRYVDEYSPPGWLGKVTHDKRLPAIKDLKQGHQHHLESGKWVTGSSQIVNYLEDARTGAPRLGRAEDGPYVGPDLFRFHTDYLRSFGQPDEEERKTALLKELSLVESWLERECPFFGGDAPSAKDFELAPQLHHIEVACKAFKHFDSWHLFPHMEQYVARMKARPSWQRTRCAGGDDALVSAWRRRMASGTLQGWGAPH